MPDQTDSDRKPHSRWLTKRFVFSAAGLAIATGALFSGKMTDGTWVYALAVVIAGHHAADIIAVWKGRG